MCEVGGASHTDEGLPLEEAPIDGASGLSYLWE